MQKIASKANSTKRNVSHLILTIFHINGNCSRTCAQHA